MDSRITAKEKYGVHISVVCSKHPENKYSTKNISHIGARNIFHCGGDDCICPASDLVVDPVYYKQADVSE